MTKPDEPSETVPSCYPRYYPEGLEVPPKAEGHCAPGWEAVRAAFEATFVDNLERGASVCVYHRGVKVVDLWGGERYLNVPWERDTVTCCFSVGKGVAALGIALLHSRGLIDFEAPVCRYWPEFAANGKEKVTVRDILSHRVGACVLDTALTPDIIADPALLSAALSQSKLEWSAADHKNGYMGLTIGWYDEMLCRRVDPQGRGIVEFVRDEIAAKVGVRNQIFCGEPSIGELDRSRIASLNAFSQFDMVVRGKFPSDFINNFVFKPSSYAARTFKNPAFLGDVRAYGEEYVRKLIVPAGNFHVTARGVAACYDAFLACRRGGDDRQADVDFRVETLDLVSEAVTPQFDEVLRATTAFGLGFSKPNPDDFVFGSSNRSFGCPGTGGQFAFADPDEDLTMAYVTNRLGLHLAVDPRELRVRAAVYQALASIDGANRAVRPQLPDNQLRGHIDKGNEKETTRMDPCLRLGPIVPLGILFVVLVALGFGLGFGLRR